MKLGGRGGIPIKHKKIADAKLAGKRNRDIAMEVYPDSKPLSGQTYVANALSRPLVQKYIRDKLNKHNITIERALKIVDDAFTAEKIVLIRNEHEPTELKYVPDYPMRLKAAHIALSMLHAYDKPEEPTQPIRATDITPLNQDNPELRRALVEAMKNGDIEAVERIVFKKETKEVLEHPQT